MKVSHNDTSPSNILIDTESDESPEINIKSLVLTDFGISSVMKNSTV
jgi:serine/threonine protein kinase